MAANKESLGELRSAQNGAYRTLLLADSEAGISEMHRSLGPGMIEERRTFHRGNICQKSIYK